jgi:small-conductance mechanosensitive channel
MNTEALQTKHNEMQQRLINVRERIRQTEQQLQELANAEQQLLGAIAIMRELMALQPDAPQPVDNTAQ